MHLLLRTVLIACCALLLPSGLQAQDYSRHDAAFAKTHTFELASNERVMRTWYHYTVSKVGTVYAVRTFFPETGALTSYHTYRDVTLKLLDGPFALYSDDGAAVVKGTYLRGQLQGEWTSATNGALVESGVYESGLRIGVWTQYFPNGKVRSSFSYDGGEELGPYVLYDTVGVVVDTGNSMFGERYTNLAPAEFDLRRGRSVVNEFPCFGSCDPGLSTSQRTDASGLAVSQYIQRELQYPDAIRKYGVQGRVNASVLINRDGKVADVRVVNGLCGPIAAECQRLLMAMPPWRPGTKGGQAAEVWVLVPFGFGLR